jgi:hemerythrin-like domain-containing protein
MSPLIVEHRLIERMISVMKDSLANITVVKRADPPFIDKYVDFGTCAHRCHQGKDEGILSR